MPGREAGGAQHLVGLWALHGQHDVLGVLVGDLDARPERRSRNSSATVAVLAALGIRKMCSSERR